MMLTLVCLLVASQAMAGDPISEVYPEAANSGCMKCHAGIELTREPGSQMLDEYYDPRSRAS
ncbi:hypothetical protein Pla144_50730 [Bythopirellula polymerisocia]|uniref:Cytochrome c-552/4 domain-containing protein n=1 Tax=Bythopirellula polymerisocia TaxID=2528003 RepID=A0A5C6C2V3_9BACT|nr:hypothetical protein Pla144_50730 [Bythopirellula polymerisocia]